jgi:hypothetical protein
LNLDEMLGDAIEGGSDPGAPAFKQTELVGLPGLPEDSDDYAGVLEDALRVETSGDSEDVPDDSGDVEISGLDDDPFLASPDATMVGLPPVFEERRPPASRAPVKEKRTAREVAAPVPETREPPSGAPSAAVAGKSSVEDPQEVVVPIKLMIDRDTEEMELQITLQIRVSRVTRSA